MVCNFSKVAFSVFGLPIHWYSLAYISGIIVALKLAIFFSKRYKIRLEKSFFDDFTGVAVAGIIIGGRLGHVFFYDWDYYSTFPIEIFKIWKGGMSFYGGFAGVAAAAVLFCGKRGISPLKFTDLWSVGVPVGLFFGRIANFINGELCGKKSDVPWSVVFADGVSRHPSQLYEAFFEGGVLFILMLLSLRQGYIRYKGRLSGIFCAGYAVARFVTEFFREPDSAFACRVLRLTGLNPNQYASVAMFLLGVAFIIGSRKS
ncbi:MAG: prolipoprotein diacylglyceryl transferase [Holosporaceae bacterium]|nr:prolipoprotein diacylglyceryl transferase [Holosporaceae bacterium]